MRTALPPPSPLLIKAGVSFVSLLVQEGLGVVRFTNAVQFERRNSP
jgi:hypothetical protein